MLVCERLRSFIALWPIFWPIFYFAILRSCRRAIKEKRHTPLMTASLFLHSEYKGVWYMWEPLALLQRLLITGFVRVIASNEFFRLFLGLIFAFGYFSMLLIVRPYRRKNIQLLAVVAQSALVLGFICSLYIKTFDEVKLLDDADGDLAQEFVGFVSTDNIATIMLSIHFSVIFAYLCATAYQVFAVSRLRCLHTATAMHCTITAG